MATQRDLETVEEYTDRISGVKAKRPGLDKMMTDARRGRFDVVLVRASEVSPAKTVTSTNWQDATLLPVRPFQL